MHIEDLNEDDLKLLSNTLIKIAKRHNVDIENIELEGNYIIDEYYGDINQSVIAFLNQINDTLKEEVEE
jgi:hypothetical protein